MNDKFQVNFDIIRLYDENNPPPPVTKVGIMPFVVKGGQLKVLLMRPTAEAKYLGDPTFQLAKGTRRVFINDHWCDMREDDLIYADESFFEPLIGTALREGNEEIGLKAGNVLKAFDMGGFKFTSVSKKASKKLHMFAVMVKDARDFDAYEATTGETRWLTEAEFSGIGRGDHVTIVGAICGRLREWLAANSK